MISLAQKYYLVINDKFELFYRGVIKCHNPYQYYVKTTCEKGFTYNRYYTYTPKDGEEGEYQLVIGVYDDEGNVLEQKSTTLMVLKVPEVTHANILCIGDSLTVNGVWPLVGFERYSEIYNKRLNFIGKCHNDKIGFEGYGGWQWKTFCQDNNSSTTSNVWVKTIHDLDDSYQHSVWESNGLEWILETIEPNRLKFKRGKGNNTRNPALGSIMNHLRNGEFKKPLEVLEYNYSEGNPFWNPITQEVDFTYYVKTNNIPTPDYVFILLSWNGQYIPYNKDFTIHDEYSSIIINKIHEAFPNAQIGLLGIQLPCPNGGITACYGANGYYHDWYGETITAHNYDEFLETKCQRTELKDYVTYFDTKSQFDSEYNYYTKQEKVNARNSEIFERIGINGIHPSMNGYKELGDIFYRALVYQLTKHKEK